ncbi:MAG: hypothetical protein ACRC8A_15915 [Microcoleaceae cyanobacterium]
MAVIFGTNSSSSGDSLSDFNSSEGDSLGFGGFGALGVSSFNFDVLNTSSSDDIPYIVEFRQEGQDLLIGDSLSDGYIVRLVGLGDMINDPLQLLPSIDFSGRLLNSNPENSAELGGNSELSDPLTGLRESEATLIQAIEQLKAGGSLYDLGFQGAGLETLKPEDLQGALSEVQGNIANELAQKQEVANLDSLLLPTSNLVVKQIFLVEAGTAIPSEFQAEMAGDEIFFLPTGYFSGSASANLF